MAAVYNALPLLRRLYSTLTVMIWWYSLNRATGRVVYNTALCTEIAPYFSTNWENNFMFWVNANPSRRKLKPNRTWSHLVLWVHVVRPSYPVRWYSHQSCWARLCDPTILAARTLGQEFHAYGNSVASDIDALTSAVNRHGNMWTWPWFTYSI